MIAYIIMTIMIFFTTKRRSRASHHLHNFNKVKIEMLKKMGEPSFVCLYERNIRPRKSWMYVFDIY